jgi:hypothetical protein
VVDVGAAGAIPTTYMLALLNVPDHETEPPPYVPATPVVVRCAAEHPNWTPEENDVLAELSVVYPAGKVATAAEPDDTRADVSATTCELSAVVVTVGRFAGVLVVVAWLMTSPVVVSPDQTCPDARIRPDAFHVMTMVPPAMSPAVRTRCMTYALLLPETTSGPESVTHAGDVPVTVPVLPRLETVMNRATSPT